MVRMWAALVLSLVPLLLLVSPSTASITTIHLNSTLALIISSSPFPTAIAPNTTKLMNVRIARLHEIRKTILSNTCDYVVHPALGQPFAFNDLLNGASVGADLKITHLAEGTFHMADARSGHYVVRRCDNPSNMLDPCPVYAAGTDPNLSPSRSIFHAGPSRVLLHDAATGDYDVLFFDADVHGSGAVFRQFEGSIFSGRLNITGPADFVYLAPHQGALEFMAVHTQSDGKIQVFPYDSKARKANKVFGRVVATGHVTTSRVGTIAKPYGDGDMIVLNQNTGLFQIMRFQMVPPDVLEMSVLSRGNLTRGHPCASKKSVKECSSEPTCGWCIVEAACKQLSGRTLEDTFENCDGTFCHIPNPLKLQLAYRAPVWGKESNSVQTAIPLSMREYLDSLENDPDPENLNQKLEEDLVQWESSVPSRSIPNFKRVQRFFVPPPNEEKSCMNELGEQVECEAIEGSLRSPDYVSPNPLQPEISPSEKTLDPSQPGDLSNAISTMPQEYMEERYQDKTDGKGSVRLSHLPYKNITEDVMEAGLAPCNVPPQTPPLSPPSPRPFPLGNTGTDQVIPGIRYQLLDPGNDLSSEDMVNAMVNAQNSHPEQKLEGEWRPPMLVGGNSVSSTISPTPSPSHVPSESSTPTASPSFSITPSTSPTMRPHPCPGIGAVRFETLTCGRCVHYWWTPFDYEKHLTRKIETYCEDELEDLGITNQQLAQINTASGYGAIEPVPEISSDILARSRNAEPPPPIPASPPRN